jgi:predicted acyltransferase
MNDVHNADGTRASTRLLSLDAFRGLTIVLMFMVNVAGPDPAFPSWFAHRGWNEGRCGNGLADYVFPWFLFIVGAAIPFSMNSGRGRGQPAMKSLLVALQRGALIYLLGVLIWCARIGYGPQPGDMHSFGPIDWRVLLHWDILPLIGFGYVVGVAMYWLPRWVQGVVVLAIVVYKWLILSVIPEPEAGLMVSRVMQRDINASLGWWGVALTQGLAAGACVMLGSFAGEMLRVAAHGTNRARAGRRLVIEGAAWVVLSYVWHRVDTPYSKDLFSPTYILVSAGTAGMVLGLMYLLIDIRRATTMWFLRVYGMNALAVYVLAEFLWKTVWMQWRVAIPGDGSSVAITAAKSWLQSGLGTTVGSWALVACYVLLYWMVAWGLYRKGWFIKV